MYQNAAITFLIIALAAAVFGLTSIAGSALTFAKVLFLISIALSGLSLLYPRFHITH